MAILFLISTPQKPPGMHLCDVELSYTHKYFTSKSQTITYQLYKTLDISSNLEPVFFLYIVETGQEFLLERDNNLLLYILSVLYSDDESKFKTKLTLPSTFATLHGFAKDVTVVINPTIWGLD